MFRVFRAGGIGPSLLLGVHPAHERSSMQSSMSASTLLFCASCAVAHGYRVAAPRMAQQAASRTAPQAASPVEHLGELLTLRDGGLASWKHDEWLHAATVLRDAACPPLSLWNAEAPLLRFSYALTRLGHGASHALSQQLIHLHLPLFCSRVEFS